MRLCAALMLAACGSSPPPADPIEQRAPPETSLDAHAVGAALRVAELRPDGSALIERLGDEAVRYVVAALDGRAVVTVEVDGAITEFLDSEATQQFLVCGDSRGGDAPALHHARIVDGSPPPELTAAIAWPADLALTLTGDTLRGGGATVKIHHAPTMEGEQFRFEPGRDVYLYHCAY